VKISNQIIDRCKDKIKIKDMIEGEVETCMADLAESIDCCQKWAEICKD
jgi:dynein heavy chain